MNANWEIHTTQLKDGTVLLWCGPVQVKGRTVVEALANLQEALTRQELYEVVQQHFTRQEDEYSKWVDQQYQEQRDKVDAPWE